MAPGDASTQALAATPAPLGNIAVEATSSAALGEASTVAGGAVAVVDSSCSSCLVPGFALGLFPQATVDLVQPIVGASVQLKQDAKAGTVYADRLTNLGGSYTTRVRFAAPPALPQASAVAPGTMQVTISQGATEQLAAGPYANVELKDNATLQLTGGLYQLGSLTLGAQSRLEILAPTELRIAGRLATGQGCYLGPASSVTLSAKDLRIEASGARESPDSPQGTAAVSFGESNKVRALVLAPNGTLLLSPHVVATGAFFGRDVQIREFCQINFEDGFHLECIPPDCADQNPCTADVCNSGTCRHTAVAVGTSCSDNNACNGVELCDGTGICKAGTTLVCAAKDQCHNAGTCDPASGRCSDPTKPDGTACDDANKCTAGDSCQAGTCQAGAAIATDDNNPCTTDTCDPANGVAHTPVGVGTSCSDGNACNGLETCSATGTCTPGSPVLCPALDVCHVAGVCDPASGSCSNPAAPDGTACDDGNLCTTDACQAGQCQGSPIFCAQIAEPCQLGPHCDPRRGPCVFDPARDGTPCGDGNTCNGDELCTAGVCQPGTPPAVDDGNPCTSDACDPQQGVTHTPMPGASCSDENACNGAELCDANGVCQAGTPLAVDDGNPCTVDACDPVVGVSHVPAPAGTDCSTAADCAACDGTGRCMCTVRDCTAPPGGMLGWWPGDGDANDIVGGHNGQIIGGVSFAPLTCDGASGTALVGKVGQAFAFDGANSVIRMGKPVLNSAGPFTVDAWIRPDQITGYHGIIGEIGAENLPGQYQFRISRYVGNVLQPDAHLQFLRRTGGTRPGNPEGQEVQTVETAEPFPAGVYTHVAAVFAGGSDLKIYVNGAEASTNPSLDNYGTRNPAETVIGAGEAPFYPFIGQIDEVELFDRALSAVEIRAIYAADSGGKCKSSFRGSSPAVCLLVNRPPKVNAGADVTADGHAPTQLAGVVLDDGLPAPSAVSIAWTKVSGPGDVTFANPNAVATTVTFSASGTYVLRLTASDGELSASDDVVVVVTPSCDPSLLDDGNPCTSDACDPLQGVTHAALPDGTSCSDGNPCTQTDLCQSGVCVGTNPIPDLEVTGCSTPGPLNSGCADGTREGFVDRAHYPDIAGCSGGWSVPGIMDFNPGTAPACPNIRTYDTITPACNRNAGNDSANPNGNGCDVADLCSSGWHVCVTATDVTIHSPDGCAGVTQPSDPSLFFATRQSSTGCAACSTGLSFGPECGANTCASGCAQTAIESNDLFGCGNFGSAISCGPLNRFSHDQCSALGAPWNCSDGAGGVCEAYVITKPAPTAGGVMCCRDMPPPQCFGKADGTSCDDANVCTQTDVCHAGKCAGSNPAPDGTTCTDPSVCNGARVCAAGTCTCVPLNNAPHVDAGADQTVMLPGGATLAGTIADDGLPSGTLTLAWTQVSGPGTVTFATPAVATTIATFSAAGTYVLRLTASDSELSASDDLTVLVNAAPPPRACDFETSPPVAAPHVAVGPGAWRPAPDLNQAGEFATATALLNGDVLVAGGGPASPTANAELYSPGAAGWVTLPPMSSPRYLHTATRLDDGRVLIVGGYAGGSLSSTEIFDPASRSWALAAPLSSPRNYHGSVRLQDGRVLIVGGQDDSGFLASASIYDPSSNQWSTAASMLTPRGSPTVVLLPDGRVLAAAGRSPSGGLSSSEIYDPVGNTWTPTGNLSKGRFQHAAAVVQGKVLVVGGLSPAGVLDDAEIFDPGTGVWSSAGKLATPRMDHVAMTLDDGKVLVVGGGPGNDASVTRIAELYDPQTSRWSQVAWPRGGHRVPAAAVLYNGDVLIAGESDSSAEIYRPRVSGWAPVAPMQVARHDFPATLLQDGRVLVTGGFAGPSVRTNPSAEAEIYDPGSDTWTRVPDMSTPRARHRSALLDDGRVLVTGGVSEWGASVTTLNSAETFDPRTNTWTLVAPMAGARYVHTETTLCDGRVLVTGGFIGSPAAPGAGDNASPLTEVFDPASNMWQTGPEMSGPRHHHTATTLADGKVLLAGGALAFGPDGITNSDMFDPELNDWATTAPLSVPRGKHRAVRLGDGRVLIAGGYDPGGTPLASADMFDPGTSSWTLTASMHEARVELAMALVDPTHVLAAGGWNSGSSEIFDAVSGQWALAPAMNAARGEAGAARFLNGVLVVAGGFDQNNVTEQSAEMYVIADDTSARAPTAKDDSYDAGKNSSLSVPPPGVLANDLAEQASTLTATLVQPPGHGAVTLNADGSFTYTAVARFSGTDSFTYRSSAGNLVSNEATVSITVTSGNAPPTVSAGSDQTITLPASASLQGTASDDGLPTGSTLTCAWSVVSGSSSVQFSAQSACQTSASFGAAGTYTLRLTASDGQLSSSDDVVVTVSAAPPPPPPPPPGTNQPPVVNAGPDRQATSGVPIILTGAYTDDGLPAGGTISIAWGIVDGPVQPKIDDNTQLALDVLFPEPGTYTLALIVNDGELDGFDTVVVQVAPPVNQAPSVNAGADQMITFPGTAQLAASISDDGLPTGSTLSVGWSEVSGTPGVTFSNPGAASTSATFPAPGTYVLRATASDGELSAFDELSVVVNPPAPNQAPVVSAGPDIEIQSPQNSVTLTGSVLDDGLPSGGSLTRQWTQLSGPANGSVQFSPPDAASTTATFSVPGRYTLRLSASDGELSSSDDVTVMLWAASGSGSVDVALGTPAEDSVVTSPTAVTGSATGTDLFEWYLEYQPADASAAWVRFADGSSPVTSSTLGSFDPTLLLNGIYTLRLTAVGLSREVVSTELTVSVEGNQKVGNFTVSFKDLSVPVAGIPIEVIRTYDSRNKRTGDFGVGWTLDINSARVQKNRVVGQTWDTTVEPSGPFGAVDAFCVVPGKRHYVTVTFADGKVFRWEAHVVAPGAGVDGRRECQLGADFAEATVEFEPLPPTTATLSRVGGNAVLVNADWPGTAELISADDGSSLFDPDKFVVTLHDGRELQVAQATGLEQVKDTNGNVLEVHANGLFHSSGQSVTFQRDSLGRITGIIDPAGKALAYAYSPAGDLLSFTDRVNSATQYAYDGNHFLLGIQDARGFTPIQNQYDSSGRLLKNVDASLKEITYDHDLVARTETVTDRLGNKTMHEYDDRGNVLKTTDALGHATTYSYDDRDNKLSECNPLHQCSTYTYDDFDNKLTETDPLHNVTSYSYDDRGNVLTTTDPLNHVTTNGYDANGNLTSTKDAAGNVTIYGYDSRGLQTSMTDALGHVTSYAYDTNVNLTAETDALGHVTSYTYDANGNRISQTTTRTSSSGAVETLTTQFAYDANGRLVATTNPDGSTTETEYDAVGQQKATIDGLGRRTERKYDAQGRLAATHYPDDTTETVTYDAEGRRKTSTDRAGRVTSFDYDPLGRLLTTTFPDGSSSSTAYDVAGRTVSTTDEANRVTTFAYDDAGRRTQVTDPLGNTTSFEYDAAGNQTLSTDPLGHQTSFGYDALNRRTSTTYNDGTIESEEYDALGRRTAKVDQAGLRTEYGYDALGRLVSVHDAAGGVTSYGYDEQGHEVTQTDALGRVTRFGYDPMGRRTSRTLPPAPPSTGGATETIAYDAAGNMTSKTDFMGRTIGFVYDANNRLTEKHYPDGTSVAFTYTATGRRATAVDSRGTTSYGYDARDRVTSMTYPDGRRLSYGYTPAGERKSLTAEVAGQTLTTSYAYDAAGRLSGVTDPAGRGYAYGYDAAGRRTTLTQPNGTVTSYAYDTVNHLKNLTTVHTPTGTTVQSYAYTLGPTGIRTRIDEEGGVARSYGYDALYRLTNEAVAGTSGLDYTKTFTYDAVGNRLTQTTTGHNAGALAYNYDDRDRLMTVSGAPLSWDENGNVFSQAGDSTYAWDLDDRMVKVTKSDGTVVEYAHDVDGVRVRAKVTPTDGAVALTEYLVDTAGGLSHVVAETDGGGVLGAYYLRGRDQLLAVVRATDVRYYHEDGLGSVRALTDGSGGVTDGYAYTAFGEGLGLFGNDEQPYRFAGEEQAGDASGSLYALRSRVLWVALGRFGSIDPISSRGRNLGAQSLYIYGNSDPVSEADPTGMESFTLTELMAQGAILDSIQQRADSIRSFTAFHTGRATLATYNLMRAVSSTLVPSWSIAQDGRIDVGIKLRLSGLTGGFLPGALSFECRDVNSSCAEVKVQFQSDLGPWNVYQDLDIGPNSGTTVAFRVPERSPLRPDRPALLLTAKITYSGEVEFSGKLELPSFLGTTVPDPKFTLSTADLKNWWATVDAWSPNPGAPPVASLGGFPGIPHRRLRIAAPPP